MQHHQYPILDRASSKVSSKENSFDLALWLGSPRISAGSIGVKEPIVDLLHQEFGLGPEVVVAKEDHCL